MTGDKLILEFELPEENWTVDNTTQQVLFLRKGDYSTFRPNIASEHAELQPAATLVNVATFLLEKVESRATGVEILARQDTGSGDTAGLFQAVRFQLSALGPNLDLVQVVTLFEFQDKLSDRRWAYWIIATALETDIPELMTDYQSLLSSIQLRLE